MRKIKKKRVFDVISYVAIFGIFELARPLPEAFYPVLSRITGTILYYLFPSVRIKIVKNLRICFADSMTSKERESLAKRIISEMFLNLSEIAFWLRFTVKTADDYVAVEGLDILKRLRKENKPVVAVCSHSGNFVVMMVYLMWKGFPLTWISRDPSNLHIANFFKRLRKSRNIYAIHRQNIREALAGALDWLRKNNILCMLIDQHSGEGVEVEFFGKKVLAPSGAEIFSRRFDCSVVGIFMHRTHGMKHKIIIEGPYNLARTGDLKEDMRSNMQLFYERIEYHVRQNPEQWFTWLHKRFR